MNDDLSFEEFQTASSEVGVVPMTPDERQQPIDHNVI